MWWVKLGLSVGAVLLFPLLALAFAQSPAPPPAYTSVPTSGPCGSFCFSQSIGSTPVQILAPVASRLNLSIMNENATNYVACAPASMGSPTINGNGWTIPPLNVLLWRGAFVPNDAIACVAQVTTTITVEAN